MKKIFILISLLSVLLIILSGCALFNNVTKSETETAELQNKKTPLMGETTGDINDNFDEFHKLDYVQLKKLSTFGTGSSIPFESYSIQIKELYDPKNGVIPNDVMRNQTYLYFTADISKKYLADYLNAPAGQQPAIYVFIDKFVFLISAYDNNGGDAVVLSFEVKDPYWKEILKSIPENAPIFIIKNPLFVKYDERIVSTSICTNCEKPAALNIPQGDIEKFEYSKVIDVTNSILEGKISNKNDGGFGLPEATIVFTVGGKRYEATTDETGYFKIEGGVKLEEGARNSYEIFHKNKSLKKENFTKDSITRPYLWLWVSL